MCSSDLQSKDEWLKEKLAEQMKIAWKADLGVLKRLDPNDTE